MLRTGQLSLLRYGVAVIASLLALLLRFLLNPVLQENAPLLVFIVPVTLAAWYGGLRPGLLATALSAAIGTYFFITPTLTLGVASVDEFVRLCIFLIEGVIISWLSQALQNARQKAEQTVVFLQESEERYRLLVEGVKDYAIFRLDPDGCISSWNAGLERIKGYSETEIIGRHFSIFFVPEDVERHQPEQELQIAATAGTYKSEGWRRRKDGSLFWADVVLTPLRDADGNLQGFSQVTRDLTERKQAREELVREKAIADLERKRLHTVLELLPVGVFIADSNGRFVQVNAVTRQIWGKNAPMAKGITEYRKYKGWSVTGKPIAPSEWALARALIRGEIAIDEEINIEAFDGQRKTILNSAVPIRDETGTIVNAVVVNVDITQRKQAEEALRRSARRLEVLHNIDQAILEAKSVVDLVQNALVQMQHLIPLQQALVILFNFETQQAEILTSTMDGIVSASNTVLPLNRLCDRIQQNDSEYATTIQQCPPELNRFLNGKKSYCVRIPLLVEKTLIGELIVFLTQTIAFSAEYRAIATEIASQLAIAIGQARLREQLQRYTNELEQRVANRTAKLEQANQELEAFAYSVSHDLRAPVRAIEGFGQILLEDYAQQLGVEGQNYTQRIINAAQHMNVLIHNLLNYSRLSRAEMSLRSLNLSAIVTEVLTQLRSQLQECQAQVTVEHPLPEAIAHPTTLMQAIANLLTNAIKFTSPNVQPVVRIWGEKIAGEAGEQKDNHQSNIQNPKSKIRLWVEDNGIGIEPQYHQRIFQVFERLHGAEVYPGTGIGLAIVRRGVERMGGQVGLESQAGQGSRFWMELTGTN